MMAGTIVRLGMRSQPTCCTERPPSDSLPLRTVWRCDECGTHWITYYQDVASGWGGPAWRRKWLPNRRQKATR
jgi:hypothetical protein